MEEEYIEVTELKKIGFCYEISLRGRDRRFLCIRLEGFGYMEYRCNDKKLVFIKNVINISPLCVIKELSLS